MTSRLDRLFLLLETGSTSVTRKAAALQLGEVQRLHPHELHNLLSKVRHYLHSNSWDTRIAACHAVHAIVSNVPLWTPQGIKSENNETPQHCTAIGRMCFSQFDINTVMKCGHNLLASEGKEFDESQESGVSAITDPTDFKEKLAKQRQQLNQRLGLEMGIAEKLGIDSNDIISNDDLTHEMPVNVAPVNVPKEQLEEILIKATGRGLKRKNTHLNRYKSVEGKVSGDHDIGMPSYDTKKIKSSNDENSNLSDDLIVDINYSDEWHLEAFTDELLGDLFSPVWEIRHGTATALREVIKIHGKCGGRIRTAPSEQMDTLNHLWLEDIALRLLCVIALDKFGDYISDQVVAPVRETCAQTLGLILKLLTPDGVKSVLKILLQLLSRHEWEARHGGLLGIKYLLAVRYDLSHQLMPQVYQPIFDGLKDSVDDVSAVAAAALVPVKDVLIETMPEKIPIVIDYLWDSLLVIDDLTSSTGDLLMLLSSLLTFNSNTNFSALTDLVPRLWPFLSHSLTSVRKSVLESLLILTEKDPSVWLTAPLLSDALRLLYQRCLLENKWDILELLYKVWYKFLTQSNLNNLLIASCPHLSGWICLMMHPSRIAINPNTSAAWYEINSDNLHAEHTTKGRSKNDHQNSEKEQYFIGGSESLSESHEIREKYVIRSRLQCSKFIGLLACFVAKQRNNDDSPSPIECFENLLHFHLNSKSATQKMCIAWIINEWAKAMNALEPECQLQLLPNISNKCLDCLNEIIYFDEISTLFTRLQHETREFVDYLKQYKFPIDENTYKSGAIYTFDQISALTNIKIIPKVKPKVLDLLETKRKSLQKSLSDLSRYQTNLSTCVLSAIAGAIVSWENLSDKLNPIVRPLMDSIKSEAHELLQRESSLNLVHLLKICCNRSFNTPSPVGKIIKNLVTYLCSDKNYTPVIEESPIILLSQSAASSANDNGGESGSSSPITPPVYRTGIITLDNMLKSADKTVSMRRSNSVNANKKVNTNTIADDSSSNCPESDDKQNELLRRGASLTLSEAAKSFETDLPIKLPMLWEHITYIMTNPEDDQNQVERTQKAQNVVYSLQVLEVIGLHFHVDLHPQLIKLLPHLCSCLESSFSQVRFMAARCFGMLSKVIEKETLEIVLTSVLELLEASDSDVKRQGAVEAISWVIDKMSIDIVPYIVLLIVPLLGRMSDQNDHVRIVATHCFAQIVQLMPLDNGNTMKIDIDSKLFQRKEKEKRFLEQLMNSKSVDNYEVPLPIKAELRGYQQEGVNWLGFLNKYKLHGIVADEMGLGKTLQAICILASDHFYRAQKYKDSKSADSIPLSSIAICPPTLTGHWVYEVGKFVSSEYLNPLHYTGPPNERAKLKNKIKRNISKQTYNLVIASYDIVRNDIEFFSSINWNYCILDEGHVIKNGKTKLAKAIKSLSANHRLILTGTPIQNNVLELWSLFDFLMPGFLGTERQFMARYSRPILQSRDAKSSSKEQEAGILAMESLHRQVLPFILRRMKEDVLKDLPPKIMQDYYCELSPLQAQLYEDFAKSRARQNLEINMSKGDNTTEESQKGISSSHIFQALQYLRKVCNHPKLVLSSQHPEYESIIEQLKVQNSSLSDINHAAKLCSLRQLLLDCGIGTQSTTSVFNGSEPVVNQHRALIFCQLKSMLDIVEYDLIKTHMPSVTYLRLDGSIPPGLRHSVVHRFNNDPSIDVLLLTTQVGGLGLNLTGADTVIFVEHDWNPMKDLQAMDRAHRIGQKKVVNVYRLITTGTLEEKIMGLQKFKLTIANTVISNDNASLQTMGTDQLLDLFSLENTQKDKSGNANAGSSKTVTGMKTALENLPELWDYDQYENEYDLTKFIQTLK